MYQQTEYMARFLYTGNANPLTWSPLVNNTEFLFKRGELLLYKCRQMTAVAVKHICFDPQNLFEETTVGTKTNSSKILNQNTDSSYIHCSQLCSAD